MPQSKARILIIDDEEGIRFSLRGILEDEDYLVEEAETGELGLEAVKELSPDLVFLDIWLPGMDGMEVLTNIKQYDKSLPVIMISGHGNIETAVNAIKYGAHDFIEKPLSLEKVVIAANKALEFQNLRKENLALKSRIRTEQTVEVTGNSAPIRELREHIERVAPTDAWVLITGENGTGKEIAARSIHAHSRRADNPLVAVNCAAIPEELIESELFGHERGAFTGADQSKTGKFEMANNGTLFLDEIGDMSMKTQAKILRILQEQSFERVGGNKTIKVNVRVIAATNKKLEDEIREGNFREDLYYRLRVFPIYVPPLRERGTDVILLIENFITTLVAEHGFKPLTFDEEATKALLQYGWPGNVRELKNFVERMLIMYGGKIVTAKMLPPEFSKFVPLPSSTGEQLISNGAVDFKEARNHFEAAFLEAKLKEFDGNITRLAEAIGLERSYLYRKLRSYNIQSE
ncbi:sigma-54-dependent transcriptional regulator [Halodesulfovibrio marinisediminis]|uniref:Two-component system, NtrC family, nitrogen regulation response regulator NtrX n=1 Tax=Halodesulfovibrio marinisediminis DSM 17456 TaxID=1121457 RepID=A0A1N6FRS4_9BACT|nr:sigma-54 dependent transcriptional regulator [Halodesulfovibrio marinisediminis]SIN97943.1 two-component system, NtrC family, nitrogen regulation response regulator NtrX [Halodesulfovibrio marinisediminis DSM 17456]